MSADVLTAKASNTRPIKMVSVDALFPQSVPTAQATIPPLNALRHKIPLFTSVPTVTLTLLRIPATIELTHLFVPHIYPLKRDSNHKSPGIINLTIKILIIVARIFNKFTPPTLPPLEHPFY